MPYRGAGPSVADVMAGVCDGTFDGTSNLPNMQAGRLRPVGTAGDSRHPLVPDVPTFREQGVDLVFGNWYGFFAPGATPEPVQRRIEADLRAALAETLPALKLDYEEKMIWNSPAVKFAPELIDCVDKGVDKAGYSKRRMVSGAGHDAVYLARVAPTTMIFVPCEGGLSHNEYETIKPEEAAAGTQVLLNAVLEYDASLA